MRPSITGIDKLRLRQRRADVRRHVVRTFGRVPVARVVFRRQALEEIRQIEHHVGIGILLNHQRRRSVLDEDRQQARLELPVEATHCATSRVNGYRPLPRVANLQSVMR